MNTPTITAPTARQQALTLAWEMVHTARLSFRVAQAKAWATIKLTAAMQKGPVGFWYTKEDGTTRFAVGHHLTAAEPTAKPAKPLVVRYFDTQANGIRSFRADRINIA